MATAGTLISASMKEIGVLAAGETATAEEASDALDTLNRWIDSLGLERLAIYTVTRSTFSIVSGTGTYTVGSGGTVNIAWPSFIEDVRLIDTAPAPDLETPLGKLTEQQYQALPMKAQTSSLPVSWYYNPTFPLGALSLFPIPTQTGLQGALYAWTAVPQFASVTTAVSLPPGYERMIVKNLAIELCPSYERQPSSALVLGAQESKANVKRANKRTVDLSFEASALIGTYSGRYDINSDSYL